MSKQQTPNPKKLVNEFLSDFEKLATNARNQELGEDRKENAQSFEDGTYELMAKMILQIAHVEEKNNLAMTISDLKINPAKTINSLREHIGKDNLSFSTTEKRDLLVGLENCKVYFSFGCEAITTAKETLLNPNLTASKSEFRITCKLLGLQILSVIPGILKGIAITGIVVMALGAAAGVPLAVAATSPLMVVGGLYTTIVAGVFGAAIHADDNISEARAHSKLTEAFDSIGRAASWMDTQIDFAPKRLEKELEQTKNRSAAAERRPPANAEVNIGRS